ncbi:hypothetical protein BBB02_05115 [Wolbachia endosymbiont of Bemisia tabaci]|uniref:hypothetical protein n=1 Tax=Wolbachia endosymbiont of Bemisia tabaci TaxID=215173 RepID=UPI000FD171B8|nr:hypothetical protein [Wolbachia endosymbiont of Bemisia tabaci]AZU37840.1 hypothetical protein BBB02_05115 [Wolbachia endosymbiont of Bemisia tabaci]
MLAWLYLKTIGRILPGRWNKWAENTLYYNKIIADNGVQTDDLLNSNREKELKDENERLKEKLKEGSKKEENQSNLNQELTKKEKEIIELKEQVKLLGKEKEVFAKFFAAQAQQIGNLQLENEELKSKLAELKKSYKELAEVAEKKGEEFLAQLKEKSEKILDLNKELINLSTKFANEKEKGLVEIEEKEGKISSLTELNKVLEQEKKEMETKNSEQQQTIIAKENRIKEQEDLIKSFHENKDINETVKKENKSLRAQNTELESKFSQLKNESDTKINQLESQLKEKQAEFTQAEEKILNLEKKLESAQQQLEKEKTNLNTIEKEKKELESEVNELKEKAKKKDAEVENLKQQLEKDKSDSSSKLNTAKIEKKELEDEVNELKEKAKGKDAEVENLKQQLEKEKTNLNTIEKEKKELESEVDKLQEKLQKLEESNVEIKKQKADLEKKLESSQGENKKLQKKVEHLSAEQEKAKSVAVLSITDSTKTLNENLTLKNQQIESSIAEGRQQKLKNEQKDAGKKSEGMNKKTKAQAKTKEVDTVSTVSTAKSTASKFLKRSKNLFVNESLDKFLSDQNAKLKEGFPEFKGKHFCHNVLGETINSLQYQNGYKFKSDQLLELLKSNLTRSARDIIEAEVKGVVKKYCNIGNIDKELRDGVLKEKLLLSIKKCMKNLSWDEGAANAITDSVLNNFHSKDNSNLQEIVSEELIKGRMNCFSGKVQELASSIRDKFLCPDEKMCVQTSEENNEYQLTEKAKKEYIPNSSMSHSNTTNVSKGRFK